MNKVWLTIFLILGVLFLGLSYFISPHEYRWGSGLGDLVSSDAALLSGDASVMALIFAAVAGVTLAISRRRSRILFAGPILILVIALAVSRLIWLAQLPPGV